MDHSSPGSDGPQRWWTLGDSGPTWLFGKFCKGHRDGRQQKWPHYPGLLSSRPWELTLKGACGLQPSPTSTNGHLGVAWVWRRNLFSLMVAKDVKQNSLVFICVGCCSPKLWTVWEGDKIESYLMPGKAALIRSSSIWEAEAGGLNVWDPASNSVAEVAGSLWG